MHQSNINVVVHLDEQKIPQNIQWSASDSTATEAQDARAMMLTFWDPSDKTALRIDLWTNELEVGEMKRFCIESVGGMAETILGATGDKVMRDLMIDCVTKMAKHLEEEEKKEQN